MLATEWPSKDGERALLHIPTPGSSGFVACFIWRESNGQGFVGALFVDLKVKMIETTRQISSLKKGSWSTNTSLLLLNFIKIHDIHDEEKDKVHQQSRLPVVPSSLVHLKGGVLDWYPRWNDGVYHCDPRQPYLNFDWIIYHIPVEPQTSRGGIFMVNIIWYTYCRNDGRGLFHHSSCQIPWLKEPKGEILTVFRLGLAISILLFNDLSKLPQQAPSDLQIQDTAMNYSVDTKIYVMYICAYNT